MLRLPGVQIGQALNRSHPLARGLNGAWFGLPGRRGGFRLYDMAGVNHATISSGTVWEGNAVKFSSTTSNSAIVVGNASVPPALSISSMATWSMFMYLKLNSSQSDSWPVAMTYGRWGASLGLSSASSPAGRIEHWRNNSSNYLSNTTVPTGEWLQIGIVFNGSSVTFYLKGAADGTSTTGSYEAANGFGIGGNTHGGGGALQGSIASAFLYSRALSDAEAVQLNYEMASGFPALLSRRRAWWGVSTAVSRPDEYYTQLALSGTPGQIREFLAKAPADVVRRLRRLCRRLPQTNRIFQPRRRG